MNRFSFVGTIVVPKEESKFVKKITDNFKIMNFVLKSDNKMNTAFVELPISKIKDGSLIKVFSTDTTKKSMLEIPYKKRFDKETLNMVSNMSKYRTNLSEDGKIVEFITQEDLFNFIYPVLSTEKDLRVKVTGRVKINEYNGNYFYKFEIKDIFTDKETPSEFELDMELTYTKKSLYIDDNDSKLLLNAYTEEYISKIKENRFVPLSIIFDKDKLNLDNDKDVTKLKGFINTFTINDNKVMAMRCTLRYFKGAEKENKTIDDLTDFQREQCEIGTYKLDDFGGSIVGISKQYVEFTKFVPYGKFKDGRIDTELTIEDFENKTHEPLIEIKPKNNTTIDELVKDDIEDVFDIDID